MEKIMKNNSPGKENYKIVTWAANTTGNQRNDEICELAGYTVSDVNSSFSEYIMPYCNVKQKYWEQHGLIEMNIRRVRVLLDSHKRKFLNTKTEIYGLGDFLNWLEKIKGQSAGIILVCYESNDYISEILLESLHRCRLNEYFSKIVKHSVNCFDICKDKYRSQVGDYSLSNITNMLFNDNPHFKRALARATGCHKIITHIKADESNFDTFVGSYIKTPVLKPQLNSQGEKLEIVPIKERKEVQSKKVFQSNNQAGVNIIETNGVNKLEIHKEKPKDTSLTNDLKCKIIGWASNTTGRRYKDELFHIAAFSPDSMFSQYIMPKKRIYSYKYKHKMRIIKENDVKQLKDLQTGKVLETKSEALALKDFIYWLEQIKDDNSEGIVILYHEDKKYGLSILLESLRRCKLTDSFCNIVKGFVNTYYVSQDKCAHITNSFTLRNLSELLLKKQIEVGNAMIRAKVCYEIIENLAQAKTEKLEGKNADILHLIQPFVNTIYDEKKELAQLKINLNKKRKLNSMKKGNQSELVKKENQSNSIKKENQSESIKKSNEENDTK